MSATTKRKAPTVTAKPGAATFETLTIRDFSRQADTFRHALRPCWTCRLQGHDAELQVLPADEHGSIGLRVMTSSQDEERDVRLSPEAVAWLMQQLAAEYLAWID